MNVGAAIKKIRKEKGLTQGELADHTGISPTSIHLIEIGKKRPHAKNLTKICTALNVPEALVYFYGLERVDVPKQKQRLYDIVYPALEEMITKLLI